jgi:hypothetical protein
VGKARADAKRAEKLVIVETFMVGLNEWIQRAMRWEWVSKMDGNERMLEFDCQ